MTQPETRNVRRARARMTRGGRWGAKAAIVVAVHDVSVVVDRALAIRRARHEKQSSDGKMPHAPSGRHHEKLRLRRAARKVEE